MSVLFLFFFQTYIHKELTWRGGKRREEKRMSHTDTDGCVYALGGGRVRRTFGSHRFEDTRDQLMLFISDV